MNNKVGTIPVRVQTIQDKYRSSIGSQFLSCQQFERDRTLRNGSNANRAGKPFTLTPDPDGIGASGVVCFRSHPHRPIVPGYSPRTRWPERLAHGHRRRSKPDLCVKNLIENAVEAMRGKGLITIRGTTGKEWVEIIVADSGPGIAPELHDQIFELDFSGQPGAGFGKLGFGLWWVKTLMTRLGGSVTVESDGQHGTTFRLHLPSAEHKT